MDVEGCVSRLRGRLLLCVSDVEGYCEEVGYCLVCIGGYLEVEFIKFLAEIFLCFSFFCGFCVQQLSCYLCTVQC